MRISDWSSDVCSSDLSATAASAQSKKSSPTKSSLGPASPRMKPISAGARRQLIGAKQARARAVPKKSGYQLSWFLVSAETRFPGAMSEAASACATRFDRASSSAKLVSRSEEHTSALQSLMRISYAVFCLKKKKTETNTRHDKTRANQ